EWRPILRFSTLRDPAEIARFVELRVVDPQARNWLRGLAAAQRYQRAHLDLRAQIDEVDVDHHGVKFPLGQWISEQRREYAAGRLGAPQVEELEELGMVWSVHDRAWEDGYAMARRYAAEHGTLAAPKDAVVEGYPVGRWLEKRRAQGRAGTLPGERDVALDALVEGEEWNPRDWTPDWQRHLTCAKRFLALATGGEVGGGAGTGLGDVGPAVVHRGVALGRWVARQKSGWERLGDEQRAALTALGLVPPAPAGTVGPARRVGAGGSADGPGGSRPKRTREEAFTIALGAAAAYRARVGHLEVPRGHVESVVAFDGWPEDVRLGVWVTTTRSRRAKLPAERVAALDALGMRWT
ncbi:helicase associated domain-containing protein, partial [Streptomyces sp. SID3343]|uniref:helicase associated domain-containing protein n=1 Tax=Streptomyces sp. SID3343 TaxID=2690260 RepID=UPI0013C23AED